MGNRRDAPRDTRGGSEQERRRRRADRFELGDNLRLTQNLADFGGDLVVFLHLAKFARRVEVAVWDRCGGGPNKPGTRLFQGCDEAAEIGFVVGGLDLALGIGHEFEVVNAPVEVNHVPFAGAKPFGNVRHAILGRAAVRGNAVHVRLALQQFSHGQGVADGDGIADEQDTRQAGHVLNGGDGGFVAGVGVGFILALVEEFGAGYVSSGYRDAMGFLVIILVLMVKPTGLFARSGRIG